MHAAGTGERKHTSTHSILLEKKLRMAAPCLRTLVTGISPRRSGLNYKPVHVGFCGGRSGKEFSPITSVYPVSDDPRLLHTYSFKHDRRWGKRPLGRAWHRWKDIKIYL